MDIRQKFIDYFTQHGHTKVASSSLVPHGDATLLFTNAGMNQFKDVFLGQEKRPYTQAISSQKCVRAGGKHNDLENVGYTARHHTFFEMLGNFSFGDYFKSEAIALAWQFITEELKLDPSRLYVTIFLDDDQAYAIWKDEIGIDPARIFRFGEKDNFWSMGDTGPCGPCSEIFYDQAPDGSLPDQQQFAAQDDRFMEIWNLVFMQFMQHADGSREKLPNPSIDTGMGLERITSVLEGKTNNYDTSLFTSILTYISKHSQADYFSDADDITKISQRVLADHIRAMVFLIADGVLPSKDGRGYVLRRIMRRAMRHGRKIDFAEHGLSSLSEVVVASYAAAYPELKDKQSQIKQAILAEEKLFALTVDRGMHLLLEEIKRAQTQNHKKFSGETAFHLYDTYGFPVDMTADVLREHDMQLDEQGFEEAFAQHREKARGSWKGNDNAQLEVLASSWIKQNITTDFLGYDRLDASAEVIVLVKDGVEVESAHAGDEVSLLLNQTPFYGESGGQVGDTGSITFAGGDMEVLRTHKIAQDLIVHDVKVTSGNIKLGMTVQATVNADLRQATAKNHTATHMLHATLKEVLGPHVEQKGSLVAPERLRFDFAHGQALLAEEKTQIEDLINARIKQNDPMVTQVLAITEAKKTGAVSMFGEKYGDTVRVLSLGDYSKEFCGGTHVKASGEIQQFVLLKESSVSAGVRRIEALTGKRAVDYMEHLSSIHEAIASKLGVQTEDVVTHVQWMNQALKEKKKKN
ncbi:MAG: alanine--tRNA ligase, partial [Deltaproteobacteria bacterium]|nr:alanine--tRNA ligase [Deltaproteobacteria bacterium]